MREMTIGKYYSVDSVIHRLDPRVKLVVTFIYVISLLFMRNIYMYAAAFAVLLVYVKISKVTWRYIIKGTKGIMAFLVFTVILQMFTVKGADIIFKWRFISITRTGIYSALFLLIRLILIITGSSMMTYTTTPTALTDGLERLLSWMKKLGIPVHEIAMIMSIALRFIPVLTGELDRIMKAQTARGVDFNEGNIIKRVKKLLPIIVPLFVSAIRRSNDLALAMDARCYHGEEGRTKMKPLQYDRNDYIVYILLVVYLVVLIILKRLLHLGILSGI